MRKYIILFFSVSLFLLTCHSSPDGIIKPDVMTNVLTEIHLADGSMINIPQVPDSIYKYGMGRYMQIFNKYHTDTAQFRKSYKYYTMHPEDMAKIYDNVLKKLTAKSDSVTALIAKNNTTRFKNANTGKTTGGKYPTPVPGPQTGVTGATGGSGPAGSAGATGYTGKLKPPHAAPATHDGLPLRERMLLKLRMHQDSMRRHLIKPNALPVK